VPTGSREYWQTLAAMRTRAQEARTLAETTEDMHARTMMFRIAEDYERLANLADQHVQEDS
jgi:hypothetical protein